MEEYLKQILRYLPLHFVDEEVNEFIEYLSDSYRENIETKKYQFAFIAFHMLNMIFVYKTKWFLKAQGNQSIIDTLNHQGNMTFNGIFDLSQMKEKTSLEKLLLSLRFHMNEVGICKNHVDVRNNCSHASGRIYYKTQEQIDPYIKEELDIIKRVQGKLKNDLKTFLQNFLENNWQHSFFASNFQELFEENYFSHEDLKMLSEIDLPLFRKKSNNEKIIKKKITYLLLISEIQNTVETEENLLLEKLPILMIELPDKIEVSKDGDIEEIYSNELIEANITPLISDFNDKDRLDAEKILGSA